MRQRFLLLCKILLRLDAREPWVKYGRGSLVGWPAGGDGRLMDAAVGTALELRRPPRSTGGGVLALARASGRVPIHAWEHHRWQRHHRQEVQVQVAAAWEVEGQVVASLWRDTWWHLWWRRRWSLLTLLLLALPLANLNLVGNKERKQYA